MEGKGNMVGGDGGKMKRGSEVEKLKVTKVRVHG